MADGPAAGIVVRSEDCMDKPFVDTLTVGNAAWFEADTGIFVPFTIPEAATAYRMYWYNGTISAPPNIDVGIYSSAGTRLTSSGPTAQSNSNDHQIVDTANVSLDANTLYYMAMVVSTNATDTFSRYTITTLTAGNEHILGLYGCLKQESLSSTTLPSSATMAAWAGKAAYLPRFGVLLTTSTDQPKLV
jgi:hypothetical protein